MKTIAAATLIESLNQEIRLVQERGNKDPNKAKGAILAFERVIQLLEAMPPAPLQENPESRIRKELTFRLLKQSADAMSASIEMLAGKTPLEMPVGVEQPPENPPVHFLDEGADKSALPGPLSYQINRKSRRAINRGKRK